jgi:hypothetical protein
VGNLRRLVFRCVAERIAIEMDDAALPLRIGEKLGSDFY